MDKSKRIGIFGGTFNPVHLGHINSVLTVAHKQKLSKIYVVPNRENPLKTQVDGPEPEQRLEMVRIAFQEHLDLVEVDDQEIKREGPSYTVETVNHFAEKYSPEQMYLIIGADQLESFDQWKDFAKILTLTNLIVTSRPGAELPSAREELPRGLDSLVDAFERNFIQLTTGRYIEFVRLDDVEVSATDVRKRLRTERSTLQQLPGPVEAYIHEHGLYQPLGPKIGDFDKFTRFCASVLFARKAIGVRGFDLREMDSASEYSLVASGTSTRHAVALAENVIRQVKDEYGVLPQSVEGMGEGRWVLLDFGSLIVHVFYDYVRQEYQLEELWRGGQDMGLVDTTERSQSASPS